MKTFALFLCLIGSVLAQASDTAVRLHGRVLGHAKEGLVIYCEGARTSTGMQWPMGVCIIRDYPEAAEKDMGDVVVATAYHLADVTQFTYVSGETSEQAAKIYVLKPAK